MSTEMLEVGAKVRVLSGTFAGRVGVISELDGRGGALVTMGGLLSARVLLENLRPFGELARPALKSSHHRPPSSDGEGVRPLATRPKKTRSSRRSPSK